MNQIVLESNYRHARRDVFSRNSSLSFCLFVLCLHRSTEEIVFLSSIAFYILPFLCIWKITKGSFFLYNSGFLIEPLGDNG